MAGGTLPDGHGLVVYDPVGSFFPQCFTVAAWRVCTNVLALCGRSGFYFVSVREVDTQTARTIKLIRKRLQIQKHNRQQSSAPPVIGGALLCVFGP